MTIKAIALIAFSLSSLTVLSSAQAQVSRQQHDAAAYANNKAAAERSTAAPSRGLSVDPQWKHRGLPGLINRMTDKDRRADKKARKAYRANVEAGTYNASDVYRLTPDGEVVNSDGSPVDPKLVKGNKRKWVAEQNFKQRRMMDAIDAMDPDR